MSNHRGVLCLVGMHHCQERISHIAVTTLPRRHLHVTRINCWYQILISMTQSVAEMPGKQSGIAANVLSMMTSSNRNIFRVTGHLCGEFTGPRWIPHTKVSDAELWSFFDVRLNKRLSKQSWGWWFETLWRPLWRHRNAFLSHAYRTFPSKHTFCNCKTYAWKILHLC